MKNYLFIIGLSLMAASCGSSTEREKPFATAVCISDTAHKAASVYLAKDEKGNPVMSWCETDGAGMNTFYMSLFDSTEEKFLPAVAVPIEPGASIHEEGMPKVAVRGDGSIVAVYETSAPSSANEYAGAVRYLQSFDRGKTWTRPLSVHQDTSSNGSHSFASITRLSNGEVGVCWLDASLDDKIGGRPVKFASTKGSTGFQNELLIERRACECCRTAISCDAKGNISVVFRSIADSSIRDISLSTSSNNGKSFSWPVSFSNDQWAIDGCPHNGPSVINTDKATYATWFTGGKNKGVYYGEVNNDNKTTIKKQVSPSGRNIQLCMLPGGERIIAYSELSHNGDTAYSKIIANKVEGDKMFSLTITPEKAHAHYPVATSFGKSRILLAWTENEQVFYKIIDTNEITNEVKQPLNSFAYKATEVNRFKLSNVADPSCGMHIEGDVQDTIHVNDKVIGFCSKACKERFLQ